MANLQELTAELARREGMAVIVEASSHPYDCRCASCLQWWVQIGPEETGNGWSFGPFTEQEFLDAGGTIPDDELPFGDLDEDYDDDPQLLRLSGVPF